MAARKKKDAISLGCNSGSLETSSLVVTGRRGRLPRNLQLGRAGFRMYEPSKEEKGIESIIPSRALCRFHTPAQSQLTA